MASKKEVLIYRLHSMLCSRTIPIGSVRSILMGSVLVRACLFPFYDNVPSKSFQHSCIEFQENYNRDIYLLPLLLRLQEVKSLKDINNAQNNDSVSNCMVVDVPI